jgi:hypothetical protein
MLGLDDMHCFGVVPPVSSSSSPEKGSKPLIKPNDGFWRNYCSKPFEVSVFWKRDGRGGEI